MKHCVKNKIFAAILSAALAVPYFSTAAIQASSSPRLSPALDIIAAEYSTAVNGLVGTDIYFSADELSFALGVDSVEKITVVSLPEATLGRLKLGNKYVEVGQTISCRNIDSLKFVPYGNDEITAVFSFCVGSDPYGVPYTCKIYTTKKVNIAPVIKVYDTVSASAGEVGVYSGISHLGTLHAKDADGDSMSFEILSGPSNGKLILTDRFSGYYEYTSNDGYEGKDSFTVCATDKYGNRSEPAKIILRVTKPAADEVYSDMDGHWANDAVISCVRAGIIDSPDSAGLYRPNEYISRAEFLHMAMNSAGYSGFSANSTGFSDDGDIPQKYKGSVALAGTLGIIDGTNGNFYPNNQITRCEAAVIVSRLYGISGDGSIAVFADSDSVPAWAMGAMTGLYEAGILRGTGNGKLDAYSPITRGAAAQMLSAVIAK